MAAAVGKPTVEVGKKLIHAFGTIVFSDNYPTGGDTLDFRGAVKGARQLEFLTIVGVAGFVYSWVKGTSLADQKVKVFTNTAGGANAALGEHTAAAYVAGITGDTVRYHAIYQQNI